MDKRILNCWQQSANIEISGTGCLRFRLADPHDKGANSLVVIKRVDRSGIKLSNVAVAHQTHPTLGTVDGHAMCIMVV